jgi:HK97 gp10 family phage protein
MIKASVIVQQNRLPTIARELRPRVAAAVRTAAMNIQANAQTTVPVDTGRLKNSIAARQISEMEWVVGTSVDYALYVEMGTRRTPARPYLRPAAVREAPALRQAVTSIIKGL